jgi:hypothetical protein
MQAKINQLTNKGDKYNDYMIDRIVDISFSKGYFVIKRKDGRMLSLDAKLHSIAGVWPDDDDPESDGLSEVLLRGTPEDDAACRDLKAFFNLCILKGMGFEAIKGAPGEQAALNKKDNSCGTVVQNDFYYASEDPSIWANIDDERKRYLRKIQDSKKRFFAIDGGKLYEITMGGCIIDKSSFGEDKTVSPNQFGHCFACDSIREAYAAFDYRQSDEDKADASALTNELSESEFPFESKEWDNAFVIEGGKWKAVKELLKKRGLAVRGVSIRGASGNEILISFAQDGEADSSWEHVPFESYKEWLISLGDYRYLGKACVDGKIIDCPD